MKSDPADVSCQLRNISDFITKGATPTTYGFHWESSGVTFLRSECVSERGLDLTEAMFISSDANRALQRSQVRDGDILMTITGNVGRVVRLEGFGSANINQHIARIRVNNQKFDARFVYHFLSQSSVRKQFEAITTGQAYPQISLTQVRDTLVPILSLSQQRAIADALDDTDDLITQLRRHISKKRDIMQGMIQELLTGVTRLPGFSRDWILTSAGELGAFKGGSGFPTRFQGVDEGAYPFYKVSDMNLPGNETSMTTANNYISEPVRAALGANAFPTGSIVFAKVGAAVFLERKRLLTSLSCVDNNMAAFLPNARLLDSAFAYFALINFPLSSLVAVGALPSLNGTQLRSIPLNVPTDLGEQRAIARVLSDAEEEMEALEHRLKSARAIKTGMMQELLTGRTRLPVEEAVA